MEEILASIRRIIADDQSLPGRSNLDAVLPKPAHDRAEGEPAPEDVRSILRSTGHDGAGSSERANGVVSSRGPDGRAPQTAGIADTDGSSVTLAPPREEPARSYPGPDRAGARDSLFSAATDSSVRAAFSTLAATRIIDNSDELMELAREMIRPLLKAWIDEHLPALVERMVIAEIERIAHRGR